MKKVLSLILALAMVLSCVPFVFAEEVEEGGETIPDSFNLAEAYAVDTEQNPFSGTASTDYPNAALPRKGSDVWQVGHTRYDLDVFERFVPYNDLYRMWHYCRANEDDKNLTVTVTDNTKDSTRYPQMILSSTGLTKGTAAYSGASGTYHWQGGGITVQYDGGVACYDAANQLGSLGYGFDSVMYGENSHVGHQTGYAAHVLAIFTAPKTGLVTPTLKVSSQNHSDLVVWKMYKQDAQGNMTTIYPTATETSVSIGSPGVTGVTVPDKWKDGWKQMAATNKTTYATSRPTYDTESVWVEEGDQIVLRFAPIGPDCNGQNGAKGYFNLNHYQIDYQTAVETNADVVYDEDRNVDLTDFVVLPLEGATFDYDETLLTKGEGMIFTLGNGYKSGDVAAITVTNGATTQTINVIANAPSVRYPTFNGEYDILDLSEMDFGFDQGFILPFYTNYIDRAVYGTIDLGLTDEWKNSIVTFSVANKFEYLGNGRIKALARHTWENAGGVAGWINGDGTGSVPAKSNANKLLPSKRTKKTMGTPVVMTVTNPDGGSRQFGLWSFEAATTGTGRYSTAAALAENGYKFTYSWNGSGQNAVMSIEAYNADYTKFKPLYLDPNQHYYIPYVDHRYSDQVGAPMLSRLDDGGLYLPLTFEAGWNSYISDRDWPGYVGFSTTFTAPKDGVINLTNFFPKDGVTGYNGNVTNNMKNNGQYFGIHVQLYDAKGNMTQLFDQNYGTTTAIATANGNDNYVRIPDSRSVTTATVNGSAVTATNANTDNETLTFVVKKGQKVRVMLDNKSNNVAVAQQQFTPAYRPDPVFTYVDNPNEYAFDNGFDSDLGYLFAAPAVDSTAINAAGVLTQFYNNNGDLLTTVKGCDADFLAGDNTIAIELPSTLNLNSVGYARVFFFDSLSNIKPVAGDMIIRK